MTDARDLGHEIDLHLGRRMRRRRRLLGMTQRQLADVCGVRFQQIQKYECGANRLSAARLWQIAGALDVPVSYFFEGLTDKTPASGGSENGGEALELLRSYPVAATQRLTAAAPVRRF
jgi:transcriptional regulator with XRE-family HTH domain